MLVLLLAGLPLVGCVVLPQYVPLERGVEQQISTTTAHMAIRQDEIIITAQSPNVSGAVGGGLIAAMIDSQIAANRQVSMQSAVEPLYDSIDDLDFRTAYWDALEPQLRQSFKLKFAKVRKSPRVLSRNELNEIRLALKPDEAFMYVGTSYTFTQDFSSLIVMTGIDVWRGGNETPVYSNIMEYNSSLVGPGGTPSIQKWSENSGKLYRDKISEGIAESVKMVRLDMEKPRYPSNEGDKAGRAKASGKKHLSATQSIDVSGEPLDANPERLVLRNEPGRLISLPR